jgi:hypothetical protein
MRAQDGKTLCSAWVEPLCVSLAMHMCWATVESNWKDGKRTYAHGIEEAHAMGML